MAILAVGQMNIIIECAFGQLVLRNIFSLRISNLKLSRSTSYAPWTANIFNLKKVLLAPSAIFRLILHPTGFSFYIRVSSLYGVCLWGHGALLVKDVSFVKIFSGVEFARSELGGLPTKQWKTTTIYLPNISADNDISAWFSDYSDR